MLLNILYYVGWLVCATLFGAVAYNRYTSGALGLFELYDLKPELVIQAMQFGVVLLLIQTILIIVRATRWKKERVVEVVFALLAWAPFIYNFSFIRG
jgi:hypothetical protein